MKYFLYIGLFFSVSLYAQLDERINKLEQDEVVEEQTITQYQKEYEEKSKIQPIMTTENKTFKKIDKKNIKSREQNNSYLKKRTSKLQTDFARQQMLRKARFLRKRYKEALARLDNWESKKEALIASFQKKYAKEDTSFGDGNAYGKERARKRREKFYKSLEIEEQHIIERASDAEAKLRQLEEEFIFQFAVTVDEAEASGVNTPIIKDKEQKVQLLNEYINENQAWKKCWEKVAEFDRLESVADSIEKLFPESQLTKDYIASKKEENQQEMQEHIERYKSIDEEYKEKYGLSIRNDARARAILENLLNN